MCKIVVIQLILCDDTLDCYDYARQCYNCYDNFQEEDLVYVAKYLHISSTNMLSNLLIF